MESDERTIDPTPPSAQMAFESSSFNFSHSDVSVSRRICAVLRHDVTRAESRSDLRYISATGEDDIRLNWRFPLCDRSTHEEHRLDVMTTNTLNSVAIEAGARRMGLTHLALSVGSESQVDELTQRLKDARYPVLNGPRRTLKLNCRRARYPSRGL